MAQIRCRGCREILGDFQKGVYVSKFRGRWFVAEEIRLIVCECGAVWTPPGQPAEAVDSQDDPISGLRERQPPPSVKMAG